MVLQDTLIVTATLGNRKTLERTIKSVKQIGGLRVKHVIIAPEGVCAELRLMYSTIEIIPEPQSCRGIYGALNYALKRYAKDYNYLSYINDDDFWLPAFNNLFTPLDQNSDIDVVYGRVNFVDEIGGIIGEQTSSPRYKAFGTLLKYKVVLFTQQATLMRSDLFLKLKGFDESFKLVADSNFWLEAVKQNSKFYYYNKVCAAYTIQANQLSANKDLQRNEHTILLSKVESKGNFNLIFEYTIFRLFNSRIYFNRILGFNMWKPSLTK